MSKFIYFIILGGLALAAIAAVNVGVVSAGEETRSVQFSVLAEDQANYGVDENFGTIPAVSADIIEDKVHDSSVPIFTYTTLIKDKSEAGTQSEDEAEVYNDRGEEVVDKEEEKEEKEDAKEEEKEEKEDTKEEEKEEKEDAKEEEKEEKEDAKEEKKDTKADAKEDKVEAKEDTKETKVKEK
jgi:outer membrane biosynthesis protein TonB